MGFEERFGMSLRGGPLPSDLCRLAACAGRLGIGRLAVVPARHETRRSTIRQRLLEFVTQDTDPDAEAGAVAIAELVEAIGLGCPSDRRPIQGSPLFSETHTVSRR